MQAMLDRAPQAVTVSNLGNVDDTGDPAWVDRLFGAFVPMQNQVAYVVPLTYRGRTTVMVNADSSRLTPELVTRLRSWPLPLDSGEPRRELVVSP